MAKTKKVIKRGKKISYEPYDTRRYKTVHCIVFDQENLSDILSKFDDVPIKITIETIPDDIDLTTGLFEDTRV